MRVLHRADVAVPDISVEGTLVLKQTAHIIHAYHPLRSCRISRSARSATRSCRRRRPRGVAAETVSVGDREHLRPIRHERRHVPARRAPRRPRPFRARRPDDARVRGHRSSARSVAIRDSTRSPSSRAHPRRRRRNPSSHGARQSVTRPAHERRARARGSRAKVATSVWTLGSPSKVSRWVCRGRSGLSATALFRVTLRITGGRVRGDAARTSRDVCIRCAGDSARASNAAARATTSASDSIRRAVRVLAVQRAHARARPRKR